MCVVAAVVCVGIEQQTTIIMIIIIKETGASRGSSFTWNWVARSGPNREEEDSDSDWGGGGGGGGVSKKRMYRDMAKYVGQFEGALSSFGRSILENEAGGEEWM